jgi:hypothetical protein
MRSENDGFTIQMQDIINWYSNLESMAKGDLNMILEI